jgi:hypothetical protein
MGSSESPLWEAHKSHISCSIAQKKFCRSHDKPLGHVNYKLNNADPGAPKPVAMKPV